MRLSLLPVLMFGMISAYGQKGQPLDTGTVFHDIFTGELGANRVTTVLQLDHKRYADEGNFIWEEPGAAGTAAKIVSGEWTVVEGDAHDEYATVVELDPPGGTIYFLRKKDGRLLQLDSMLEEMKPLSAYVLKKDNRQSPIVITASPVATPAVKALPMAAAPPHRQAQPKQPEIAAAPIPEKKPAAASVPAADTVAEDVAESPATETTGIDTVAATEAAIEKTGKREDELPAVAETLSRADSTVWQVKPVNGTYRGTMPCADCAKMETTLTLECSGDCASGNYTSTDKYVATPHGDREYTRGGEWKFDETAAGTGRKIIILDTGNPATSGYYMVKANGDMLPLDANKRPFAAPYSGLLRKVK